jgi:hypothetical protein
MPKSAICQFSFENYIILRGEVTGTQVIVRNQDETQCYIDTIKYGRDN